jgi:transcriptional antiterminator RfaH
MNNFQLLHDSQQGACMMSAPTWFAAWTKPKHEHIAAANLARSLGLEVFLPRLQLKKVTRRGWMRVTEPLFPGYLFVRCVLEDRINDIQHTTGVKRMLQFGGKFPAIPNPVIEELQKHFEGDSVVKVEDPLSAGDEVTVASGPFAGMSAYVLRTLPAKERVQILLEILGRPTAVEVGRQLLTVKQSSLAVTVPFLAAISRREMLPV